MIKILFNMTKTYQRILQIPPAFDITPPLILLQLAVFGILDLNQGATAGFRADPVRLVPHNPQFEREESPWMRVKAPFKAC